MKFLYNQEVIKTNNIKLKLVILILILNYIKIYYINILIYYIII